MRNWDIKDKSERKKFEVSYSATFSNHTNIIEINAHSVVNFISFFIFVDFD